MEEKKSFEALQYSYELGNLGDNRESLLEQSKERIISFFDKEQASNNFQEYSQYLRENHNVAIIKWDDIKQGANKNEGYKDGFTVIDLENKIAYKGEDLYRYAYEQNQTLDGKGSYVDIDWNKFNEVGVKPENCKYQKWEKNWYAKFFH